MFQYHSQQVQTIQKNGKGATRLNVVSIRNGQGTKKVVEANASGAITHQKTKRLSRKEIETIRKGKFIPGLFQECMRLNRKTRRRTRH